MKVYVSKLNYTSKDGTETWDLSYADGRQVAGFFSSKESAVKYAEMRIPNVQVIEE